MGCHSELLREIKGVRLVQSKGLLCLGGAESSRPSGLGLVQELAGVFCHLFMYWMITIAVFAVISKTPFATNSLSK